MNVMNKFTIRSLKLNKKWTVVTIIGIIISTAMTTAVASFCSSFMALIQNEVMENTGNWHAAYSNVSVNKVNTVKKADFVSDVMLKRNIGFAKLNGLQNSNKPFIYIQQFDNECGRNFKTTLVSGRMPKNDNELVISEMVNSDGGENIKVGDKITVNPGKRISLTTGNELDQNTRYQNSEDNPNGEKFVPGAAKTYTVVGFIKQPAFEGMSAPGYTAISYLDDSTLKSSETVNVSFLVKNLNHSFFSKVDSLAKSIGVSKSNVSENTELLRYYGVMKQDSYSYTLYGFALVLIIIIMVASISLIYNAFAISVSERIRQLGMLASVGATKWQKRKHVYFEGFLIGIIGIPLGIIAGLAGIGITLAAIQPLLNSFINLSTPLHLVVSPVEIIVPVIFAALTIFISSWIPARRASKITPIDAIRQSKEIKLTNKVVKTNPLTRALFGFEGEIALKNLKRSRRKYRATVLSLIISLVLFLTVSFYVGYIEAAMSAMSYGINFDFDVTCFNLTKTQKDTMDKIPQLSAVKDSAEVKNAVGTFKFDSSKLTDSAKKAVKKDSDGNYPETAYIYSYDTKAFEKYAKSLGLDPKDYEDPSNPKAIVINYAQSVVGGKHAVGKVTDLKSGDPLTFISSGKGSVKYGLTVGAVTDERPMGVLYQAFDSLAVVMSDDDFSKINSGLISENQEINESVYLLAKDNDKLQTQIDNLTKGISNDRLNVTNISAEQKKENNISIVNEVFIYGFIILISLICIANIFNTIQTNITLRRKEFAMLRSVGMTPKSFNRMLRYESVFYGLKALLYGIPISFGIQLILYRLVTGSLDTGFMMPWLSYGMAIALIFIIVFVTMLYSSAKVKKENIIDGLKEDC